MRARYILCTYCVGLDPAAIEPRQVIGWWLEAQCEGVAHELRVPKVHPALRYIATVARVVASDELLLHILTHSSDEDRVTCCTWRAVVRGARLSDIDASLSRVR